MNSVTEPFLLIKLFFLSLLFYISCMIFFMSFLFKDIVLYSKYWYYRMFIKYSHSNHYLVLDVVCIFIESSDVSSKTRVLQTAYLFDGTIHVLGLHISPERLSPTATLQKKI